jgi:hypothetical protein
LWLLLLLLRLQIHGCHCKNCKRNDASNFAAPGGDCSTADDAAELTWPPLLLLLLLQIHGCHCKHCKKNDASNEAAPGGDCFTADDAAGADLAATPFAAAAGSEDNKKKGWPVRLVTKYIVPPREWPVTLLVTLRYRVCCYVMCCWC